jgi:hypothetical protein
MLRGLSEGTACLRFNIMRAVSTIGNHRQVFHGSESENESR